MTDDQHPIYSVRDGWTTTADPCVRYDNPNWHWWNALWEPKKIVMQRMTKLVGGELYVKWVSISGNARLEWSEETGAEG